jgi:hypothetical protein
VKGSLRRLGDTEATLTPTRRATFSMLTHRRLTVPPPNPLRVSSQFEWRGL